MRFSCLLKCLPTKPACAERGSDSVREGLGRLAGFPLGRALERLNGARLVEVDHGVELIPQPGLEVVADAFGLRSIDDAYRPLQARLPKARRQLAAIAQCERDARAPDRVEEGLVAPGQRRAHVLAVGRGIPVRGGRD